jgi:hypothetical protein
MTLKRPRDPNQLAKLIIDIARGRNLTATPTPVRTRPEGRFEGRRGKL